MPAVPMKVDLIPPVSGNDILVVNAARVSFGKETAELRPSDEKLIRYLADNQHWVPFAHCGATFRIKAPLFVARQLVKHQVGFSWSETSRRYVDDAPEYWLPYAIRTRPNGSIKQGSGGEHDYSQEFIAAIEQRTIDAIDFYDDMIKEGAAPEQARMTLPLNCHTEWFWTGSLAAWARMCKLRLDTHAQAETREVAAMIAGHMQAAFPVSWAALMGVKDGEVSA